MIKILQEILDWSEVWALLIPLAVLFVKPNQPFYFKPIIIYLWLGLVIDVLIDVGWKFRKTVPGFMYPNNYLYNIHSIARFACFAAFFIKLEPAHYLKTKKIAAFLALAFAIINFLFLEKFYDPMTFSSRLLAVEAGILLLFCLQYYLFKIQEEIPTNKKSADFWLITGLSIYVVFNFFYFLFYTTLIDNGYYKEVEYLWNFHNITFIILCIFIAKAFYTPK